MSQSLFQKGRVAFLAVAHRLLDKVVDLNNVQVVKQYARDIETSLEDIGNALAEARGTVKSAETDGLLLKAELEKSNHIIDALLSDDDPNNDHLARSRMARVVSLEGRIALKQQEIQSGQATVQAMQEAYSALEAKHTAMVNQIELLEAQAASTRAKESAAQALNRAAAVHSATSEVSVDDVAARIRRQNHVADEKFSQALGKFAESSREDETLAEIEARLAQRRAQVTAKKEPAQLTSG